MSLPLDPWVPPLLNTLIFDYDAGSIVSVQTRTMGTFRGEVFQNPAATGMTNSITLINIVEEASGKDISGHMVFFQRDIMSVTVVQPPRVGRKKPKETKMDTRFIRNDDELENLMRVLEDVLEVGCYVPGTLSGRFGSPEFIVLNVKNVLVVIQMKDFENEKFWRTFGVDFFGKPTVTKVFFDSRGIADYLYHRRSICLTKVCDLRVTELLLRKMLPVNPWCGCQQNAEESQVLLSQLLEKYLDQTVPKCDMDMLSKSPLTLSEVELKKFYALKVKYLLVLKAELYKTVAAPLTHAVSQLYRKTIGENAVAFGK